MFSQPHSCELAQNEHLSVKDDIVLRWLDSSTFCGPA